MAMIKSFAPAPGIGVHQIVKRCNFLTYYYNYNAIILAFIVERAFPSAAVISKE
jgi:hypothetical protein